MATKATFKDFIKDPEGVRPRTDRGRAGRVKPPARSVYSENLNESMLKGVWRIAIQDNGHEEDCEWSYEDEEEGNTIPCPTCRGGARQFGAGECPECAGHGRLYVGPENEDPLNISGQRWSEEDQEEDLGDEAPPEEPEGEGGADLDGDGEVEEMEPEEPEDPDRAGVIRQVDNAHLVYKRQNEDSTYDELWIYNINDKINDELDTRRAILAGTDIEPSKTRSEDGTQTYELITMGNAQYVHIKGLPN